MLTPEYVIKSAKMRDQYGSREDSFSPRWHAENPGSEGLPTKNIGTVGKRIRVNLQNVLCPDGDVRLRDMAEGEELNPGESFA
jgi:hypothetical protein